jgi:hypothetical protein
VKLGIANVLKDIVLSDFDGVNDPVDGDLVCPYAMGEAIEERIRYHIEVSPDIAKSLAHAYIADVDWHEVSVEQLAKWAEGDKE